MRTISGLAALAAATVLTLSAAGAADDGRDRVHADSFGNLVIHSHAGYKRIIVGMGEAAQGYQLTGSYYEPEIAREAPREARRCWRPPYVWHGRSHMYGLDKGEIPQAPMVCR